MWNRTERTEANRTEAKVIYIIVTEHFEEIIIQTSENSFMQVNQPELSKRLRGIWIHGICLQTPNPEPLRNDVSHFHICPLGNGIPELFKKGESEAKRHKEWKGSKNKQNKARLICFLNLKQVSLYYPFTNVTEPTNFTDTVIQ